ncbi:acetate/propionate family kinase [Amycolatopsis sp. NPDC058986]|uniref:acetate/propionate family kinase n=1 Tax=unclassified Amycolatopsis TaxID=2618356 RepID=UPI00367043D4
MNVLTVNAGSSSLRAHLVDTAAEKVLDSAETGEPADTRESRDALENLLDRIPAEPDAVAHRFVHGGATVTGPAIAGPRVRAALNAARSLAPLHQPPALALLDLLRDRLPHIPHVVCPDTAFHSGLPERARTYALPERWRARWDLRRYGFHGISYGWAVRRAAELLGRPLEELDLLVAHLGGGCSVCAVHGGRSMDTSMGLTPLDGPAMSKRCGSVDPGLLLWLLRDGKLGLEELAPALQTESGLLGLSGISGDTRDLVRAAKDGDVRASFAMAVFEHQVSRALAGVAASLDRIDALVFTGDIGWDQPEVAESVADGLGVLGIRGGLDTRRDADAVISGPGAGVPVLVVESREERELAALAARAVEAREHDEPRRATG